MGTPRWKEREYSHEGPNHAASCVDWFEAVEFLFPYEFPAAEIAMRLKDNGLAQVLFNAPPGDWANGERGMACIPGRGQEFRDSIMKALDYAGVLGCPRLHVMAGMSPAGVAPATMTGLYAINLAWAAERAIAQGVTCVIEPINQRDMPGYSLTGTANAVAVIEAVGPERLGLQFDLYHTQITEGDLVPRMQALLPYIAHMQVADTPGRHEPGTGEVNWPFVFKAIDDGGYRGWIGCEYRPAGDTVAGLGWFQPYKTGV
ncbi:MAG: hydroxypyruvate isomerase [Alphaproteobacteria bacterium]|nr:hydroxypyruvate isomerase [Alphaproteobacteria bacterium]